MNNKPFWQGKTCNEMAGLHVKVTFKSGTIVTGVTDKNGDIPEADYLSGRGGGMKSSSRTATLNPLNCWMTPSMSASKTSTASIRGM